MIIRSPEGFHPVETGGPLVVPGAALHMKKIDDGLWYRGILQEDGTLKIERL